MVTYTVTYAMPPSDDPDVVSVNMVIEFATKEAAERAADRIARKGASAAIEVNHDGEHSRLH